MSPEAIPPPERSPADVALWRDAIREASALESERPVQGLIQQIRLGPDQLTMTLTTGETFRVPASSDRYAIAAAASRALGTPVQASPASEWSPPSQTVNYWWAETLYNFGLLAPEAVVMKADVVFVRIWREAHLAKIEAYDSCRHGVAVFDLRDDHPPADTVSDVLDALRA